MYPITSEPDASATDKQFVQDAIDEFNMALLSDRNYSPLNIFVRDAGGHILGGILGHIWGGCLHITTLWLAETLRHQGYGTRLLQAAEAEARDKACHLVFLETFSFQAPDFYRKQGYQALGKLDNYPPGHSYFILWKSL